jgi:hypothetical protein
MLQSFITPARRFVMGCDTRGIVVTDEKDFFLIMGKIKTAIDNLIQIERTGWDDEDNILSTINVMGGGIRMATLSFKYKGEERNLFIHFDCDSDSNFGKSIILSFGCWGNSELLMKTVLYSLSDFGEMYYDYNDCDDIDMAQLTNDIILD